MEKKRQNIVFILIDDMGWRDLGCYGSTFYETPNIDALAREGMLFTDAYAAAPVCSPTRASLMSGKYPACVGVTDWIDHNEIKVHPFRGRLVDAPYTDHLPLGERSYAAALREEGYSTWHVGKWHLGGEEFWPDRHGFEVNIGGCHRGSPLGSGYFSPYNIPTLQDGPDGEYLTDRLTSEAINLIKNRGERPFFLNMWYYSVHRPIEAKPEHIPKFIKKRRDMGLDKLTEFEDGGPVPFINDRGLRITRRLLQSDPEYAAMIECLDENIGRLMDCLKAEGIYDDTAVFFTSDNGGLSSAGGSPTCNSPLCEGKGWSYEGGVREPLIARWPGRIEAGSVCREYVTSPDFYPTFLEIAAVPPNPSQHCDGVSFVPLLKGEGLDRGPIFWHYPHYGYQGGTPASAVRMGDFKLIEFFEDERLELYNLRRDIGETKNLADIHPDKARELHALLKAWRERINARLPEKNPDFK